jgi:hypothetical protein
MTKNITIRVDSSGNKVTKIDNIYQRGSIEISPCKNSRRWAVRFRDPHGNFKKRRTTTLEQAHCVFLHFIEEMRLQLESSPMLTERFPLSRTADVERDALAASEELLAKIQDADIIVGDRR